MHPRSPGRGRSAWNSCLSNCVTMEMTRCRATTCLAQCRSNSGDGLASLLLGSGRGDGVATPEVGVTRVVNVEDDLCAGAADATKILL